MTHKTVWMVSGNKGGVGKSLLCLALASTLDMRGLEYAVFDGDGRTGDVYGAFKRKCPARWGDFRELRPDLHICMQDKKYEDIIHQLLRGSSDLIINTPDGADSVLMKWFDVTLKHTESNDYQFKFLYLMSDRSDGLEIFPELGSRFSMLYPIRNLHFGEEEIFTTFNQDYQSKFDLVMNFPVLRADEVRLLFDGKTYPYQALSLKNVHTGAHVVPALPRARLWRWQTLVNEMLWEIVGGFDMPNVKHEAWQ